jgi:hypothetical protein
MTELSFEQLTEKIQKVEDDVKRMQSEGTGNVRQINVLGDYLEYLKEQLDSLKNDKTS